MSIGRGEKANISIPSDSQASRKHAQIVCKNHKYKLIDLNSTNGTFLNQKKLDPKVLYPLKHKDIFCVGKTFIGFCIHKKKKEKPNKFDK